MDLEAKKGRGMSSFLMIIHRKKADQYVRTGLLAIIRFAALLQQRHHEVVGVSGFGDPILKHSVW